MMIRKDVVFAVLLTFCLTAMLFMIVPVGSYGTYDPWIDFNDDGKIDVKDVATVTRNFGAQGTPINKTQMLLDLQNRVDVLEEKQDYIKTIRFFTANETMNDINSYKDALVCVWNPRNATNNAILDGFLYFRYFCSYRETVRVLINGIKVAEFGLENSIGYEQTNICVLLPSSIGSYQNIMPNQNSYTVKFQISSDDNSTPVYAKDINILLEVMDGLPPS